MRCRWSAVGSAAVGAVLMISTAAPVSASIQHPVSPPSTAPRSAPPLFGYLSSPLVAQCWRQLPMQPSRALRTWRILITQAM